MNSGILRLGGPVISAGAVSWRMIGFGGLVAAVMSAILLAMGRVTWCRCGSLVPWAFDIWSAHNSQHIIDPYSPTHFQHGLLFFALLAGLSRWVPLQVRAGMGLVAEALWEVIENTERVIEHYRTTTISLDYYGDSVANSLSDLVMCGLGLLVAERAPRWLTLGLFVGIELALTMTIRDSLLLNILMLLAPSEAIRQWQAGG